MNYKKAFWILIIILILLAGIFSVYAYNNISNRESYINGYNQATIDIALSQTETGNIVFVNNQTIDSINIADICGNPQTE